MEIFYFLFFFIFERVDCYFWLVKFFFVMIKKLMIYEMCIKIEWIIVVIYKI